MLSAQAETKASPQTKESGIPQELVKLCSSQRRYFDSEDYRNEIQDAMSDAVTAGNLAIIQFLYEAGAKTNEFLYGPSGHLYTRFTYLEKAVRENNFPLAKLLIQYGASVGGTIVTWIDRQYRDYGSEWIDSKRAEFKEFVTQLFDWGAGANIDDLSFLNEYFDDISDLSFIGISLNGFPVTRNTLKEAKLTGAEKALVTASDLEKLQDESRRKIIATSLEAEFKRSGKCEDSDGIIDLTPIFPAATNGNINALKARLKAGIKPDCFYKRYFYAAPPEIIYPITLAASNGHLHIVKALDKSFKEFNVSREKKKAMRLSALEAAKNDKHENIVTYLIKPKSAAGRQRLAFERAIVSADVATAKRLLERNKKLVDIETTDQNRIFSVAIANLEKSPAHLDIVKLLIASHPMIDANYERALVTLMNACLKDLKYLEVFRLILVRANKSDRMDQFENMYPWYVKLMYRTVNSSCSGQLVYKCEVLNVLHQEYKADFNERGSEEYSLLSHTISRFMQYQKKSETIVSSGYYAVCEFLLENGVDPNKLNKDHHTELLFLITQCMRRNRDFFNDKDNIKIIDLLIKHGAHVNARSDNGQTALHYAMMIGSDNLAECLLEHKADIDAIDKQGHSPLYYAIERGSVHAIKLLVDRGAKVDEAILNYVQIRKKEKIAEAHKQVKDMYNSSQNSSATPAFFRSAFLQEIAKAESTLQSKINSVNSLYDEIEQTLKKPSTMMMKPLSMKS